MNKKIRFSALSLSCVMIASLFTGCGDGESDYASYSDTGVKTKGESSMAKSEGSSAETPKSEGSASESYAEVAEEAPAMDGEFTADVMGEVADAEAIDTIIEPEESTPDQTNTIIEAGQLTAGEWNDNNNWGFFQNLVNSGTIAFPSYGINPVNRIEVLICDDADTPQINAKVELLAEDTSVIWTSITDKNGKAYLFFDENSIPAKYRVSYNEISQEFDVTVLNSINPDEQQSSDIATTDGVELLTLNANTETYTNMEVMFIVDSTGSMSDEMLFLQSEFTAIANEIGTDNTSFSVNFYRDKGDEYVTRCYDFSKDISEIQQILNSENANGGGDTPEAVAEILNETITEKQWGEDTVKLAFLIFDAPPHADTQETLINAVKTASEKGIRIIPVVSSNSERDTELFGRALSICTNGTYVFLTDDSGIGDSHLEPIIGDYQVEKLYDIIIRVINEYRQ